MRRNQFEISKYQVSGSTNKNRLSLFSLALAITMICGWGNIAYAVDLTLAWDSSTSEEVVGYKLHYGTASGVYTNHIDTGTALTWTVSGLTEGNTYYFVASAYTAAGTESTYSSQVAYPLGVPSTDTPTPTETAIPQTPTATPTDTATATPAGPVDLVSDLIGHWQLNENSGETVADISGNGNSGLFYNGPTWTIGKTGAAVQFDGVDDQVQVVGLTSPSQSDTEGTLSLWVNLDSYDGINSLLSADTNHYFNLKEQDGNISFQLSNPTITNAVVLTGSQIPLGEWTHYTITWTATSAQVYKNGVLDGETTSVDSPYVSFEGATLYFGHDRGIQDRGLPGSLDEIRFYARALRSDEVAALYNSFLEPTPTATWTATLTPTATTPPSTPIPTDTPGGPIDLVSNLIGHWPLDENTGESTSDVSGNNNNGVFYNGPIWNIGRVDAAVQFDGIDDRVQVDGLTSTSQSDTEGTLSLWVYLDSTEGDNTLLSADTEHNFNLREQDGNIHFQLRNPTTTTAIVLQGSQIPLGEWVHYTVTWSPASARIYKNGILDAEIDSVASPYVSLQGATLYFAHDRGIQDRGMPGRLDEVRLYARTLRSDEVAALYDSFAEPTATPTATWTPTWTPTATPTDTETPLPTATFTPTATATPTSTPTHTPVTVLQQTYSGTQVCLDRSVSSVDAGEAEDSTTIKLRVDQSSGLNEIIFLRWDPSVLPAADSIVSASLKMSIRGTGPQTSFVAQVRMLNQARPYLPECTWQAYDGIHAWPDGSAAATVIGVEPISKTAVVNSGQQEVLFDLTPRVKTWKQFPTLNNGLAINAAQLSAPIECRFYSSETADADLQPQLIVQYTEGAAPADTTAPQGTAQMAGNPVRTKELTQTVQLSASDDSTSMSAAGQYRISQDYKEWSDFQPMTDSLPVTLKTGEGVKRVYIEYLDEAGNISLRPATAEVIYDLTTPSAEIDTN